VLQCVAVRCSVLQCDEVPSSIWCVALCCAVLPCESRCQCLCECLPLCRCLSLCLYLSLSLCPCQEPLIPRCLVANGLVVACMQVEGGEDPYDALGCRSFSAKEPLIIGLFCGK